MMIKRLVEENEIVADLFHDGSGHPRKALVLLGGSEAGIRLKSVAKGLKPQGRPAPTSAASPQSPQGDARPQAP